MNARLLNTGRNNLSLAGFDDNIENWMVLAYAIKEGINNSETAFNAYFYGKRIRRGWTPEEDKIIIWGRKHGVTYRELSELLGKKECNARKRYEFLKKHNKVY